MIPVNTHFLRACWINIVRKMHPFLSRILDFRSSIHHSSSKKKPKKALVGHPASANIRSLNPVGCRLVRSTGRKAFPSIRRAIELEPVLPLKATMDKRAGGAGVAPDPPKLEAPLVLVGENNAGKFNIVRALDLLCGEMWPSSHAPEDNEFYRRDRDRTIELRARFTEPLGRPDEVFWRYGSNADPEVEFQWVDTSGQPRWIRGEEREELVAVTTSADPRLSYHLGYSFEVRDAF